VFQNRTGVFQNRTGPGVLGRGPAGFRVRRILTAVAVVAGVSVGTVAMGTPMASAASVSAGPLCEGWSACSVAPYTTRNFQNEYRKSYWGMPPDQDTAPGGAWANCTNYVAFVEATDYGVPTPKHALPVNATDWVTGAQENGFTVDQTPTVGSVAQWYAASSGPIGSDGHVAIVEAVGPDDSYIVISQDNWHSDTDYYGWALILAGTPGQGEPWPDTFIHFPGAGLPTTLSYTQPVHLVQSTGNLYWTADQTVGGTSQADVWRASKDNVPGQERALYQESVPASSPVDFAAITYADASGTWYGYFVANHPLQLESQIMRVPLAGGTAVLLATSPAYIGNRDLATDGSFLYWADASGIRKMAIAGGTAQTLVSCGTCDYLGLDGPELYYSSSDYIRRVPTSGGASAVVVTATSAVTAMDPPTASDANVDFAEANGSVSLFPGPRGSGYQLQAPSAGVSVTSVSVAGNYVLWGECSADLAKAAPGLTAGPWQAPCTVVGYDNGNFVGLATSGPPVDVQGDGGAWYWGDYRLEKYTL
jgi:surface antigen